MAKSSAQVLDQMSLLIAIQVQFRQGDKHKGFYEGRLTCQCFEVGVWVGKVHQESCQCLYLELDELLCQSCL
jgi:hypothetical protein